MPEYLAPGVFVEETSFRQKTIEGVSTSTTGFIGPTRFGPDRGEPPLLTSFSDFERIYGGIDQLEFEVGTRSHGYLAHAVRAYFEEGGKRLYVARTFNPRSELDDGVASWMNSPNQFGWQARWAGVAGNVTVRLQFRLGPDILDDTTDPANPTLNGASNYDVVWVQPIDSMIERRLYWVNRYDDPSTGRRSIRLRQDDGAAGQEPTGAPEPLSLDQVSSVQMLTVSVTVSPLGRFGDEQTWENLTFHPRRRDSLNQVFEPEPASSRSTSLYTPLVFDTQLLNGADIAEAMVAQESLHQPVESPMPDTTVASGLSDAQLPDTARAFQLVLSGGNDGNRPTTTHYEGDADDPKRGLHAYEDLENISIVAAPGSTHTDNGDTSGQVMRQLLSHCERMRYRVAVLDSTNGHTPAEVQAVRGTIDSTRAAMYYPWVRIADPITESEMLAPPSGFVAGIYARNDVDRGVHKAPANEVIRLALEFEFLINKAQQEVLNPLGINCLRFFEGRGYRVWGARTTTSDPEWKYLNVRRYFAFLERSIEKGTQWAVFENNGDVLWTNIRRTIEDFLFNEWTNNHLMGTKPEQAYFVRCDRTTMTQNDIDNGRLVCLIGVAPLRPAEFVIFRIGQKTADSRS